MYELSVEGHFDSAHFLRGYLDPETQKPGKCASLHGHRFDYVIKISGKTLDSVGLLVDFKTVKAWMKKVEDKFDHTCLNDNWPFKQDMNPTAENLSEFIYKEFTYLVSNYSKNELNLVEVVIYESPGAGCTYRPGTD